MKTYASQFSTDIKNQGIKTYWYAVLTYDSAQSFIVTSHTLPSFASATRLGLIKSVGAISTGVSPINSVFEVPSVEIRLTDGTIGGTLASGLTDKTLSGYLYGKNFRNRSVSLYRISENMTTVSGHDAEFVGTISNQWYDNERKEWVFECVGNPAKYEKELPSTTVTTTNYPNAPKSSLGMPIPFVYGTFAHRTYDIPHNLYHFAPTVCTDKIAGTFTVASHTLDSLGAGNFFVFLPGLGVYGGAISDEGGNNGTVSTAGPSTYTLPLAEFYKLVYVYLIPTLKGSVNTVATITNIVDNDENTTVAITDDFYGMFSSLSGDGEFTKDATSAQLYSQIEGYCYVTAYTGANTSRLTLYNPDTTSAFNVAAAAFNTTGFKTSNDIGTTNGFGVATNRTDNTASATAWSGGVTTQWSWEEIARYEYGIDIGASVTCTLSVAGLRIVGLIVSGGSLDLYSPNMPRARGGVPNRRRGRRSFQDPYRISANEFYPRPSKAYANENGNDYTGFSAVFCECGGREFGTWIDNVGRSNSYSVGNPISKSNFQIESILRDELGVLNAEIDYAAFDTAETGAYDFIFSQNEHISASELIQQLSFFSRCVTTCRSNGTWTIYRFPDTPSSATTTLHYKDCRVLNVSPIDPGALANDVTVSYHYDYGKQQYMLDTNAEDTTSKADSSSGENRTALARFDCPFVRKSSDSGATNYATSIRDFLLAQWATPHYVAHVEITNKEKWGIEELDVIEFTSFSENVAGIGAGSAGDYWSSFAAPRTKYWLVIERQSDESSVFIKAMQLHDIS